MSEEIEFNRGYYCACAVVKAYEGQDSTIVLEVLGCNGKANREILLEKGVDMNDVDIIFPIIKTGQRDSV